MQILSADQIRAWDAYTIQHEPVPSIGLMERAAQECAQWIKTKHWQHKPFFIFCGKGNNGGDGLAIGRMLIEDGYKVLLYIVEFGKSGSDDFQVNLQRLHQLPSKDIHFIQSDDVIPSIPDDAIVIDALYGSGLHKSLEGLSAHLVNTINKSKAEVVAIDVPSGLFLDSSSAGNTAIKADYTLTFQCYKTALLVQENAPFIGYVHLLDICLNKGFLQTQKVQMHLLDAALIKEIFRPRNRFAHKGSFGHALLIGGSYGKIGAVVLATKGCLSSGAGLTTVLLPKCGYNVIQTSAPEAMAIVDEEEMHLATLPNDIEKFDAIGIGPGMGTEAKTRTLFSFIIRRYKKPLIIDADGLNCLSLQKELLKELPPYSILTPHPKEFDRLFGEHKNDFERIDTAKQMAVQLQIILLVKGHRTFIAMPDGEGFFNSTGNAGMAKGGSGDVLTGIITSFLAQGYSPKNAALLSVYVHGWAGDFAAAKFSKEAMLPSHIVGCLSDVFLALQ